MRKPFFKKTHKAWYVHYQGKMIRLGEDKDEAFLRYHELMASNAPIGNTNSVVTLLNSYLDWCQKKSFRSHVRVVSILPFAVRTFDRCATSNRQPETIAYQQLSRR